MALFDLNRIMGDVQKSAEDIRKAVVNLPEQVKNINIGNALNDIASKGQEAISSWGRKQEEKRQRIESALKDNEEKEVILSFPDAMKIIYSLMVIDGAIAKEEQEKILDIGMELDPEFSVTRDRIAETSDEILSFLNEGVEDLFQGIEDFVGEILQNSRNNKEGIRGKLLLWDLFTVAYSEKEFSQEEQQLIQYYTENAGINRTVCLEMHQAIQTLLEIEKEEAWLKSSNRPYQIVENRINELSDRKNVILTGVQALVAD